MCDIQIDIAEYVLAQCTLISQDLQMRQFVFCREHQPPLSAVYQVFVYVCDQQLIELEWQPPLSAVHQVYVSDQ